MRTDDPARSHALTPAEAWERDRLSWNLPGPVVRASGLAITTGAFEPTRLDPDNRSTSQRTGDRPLNQ